MARIDRTQLGREIRLKMENEPEPKAETNLKTKAFALEVAEYWKHVAWPESATSGRWPDHPYDTGSYTESISIRQNRDRRGRFVAGWTVYTNHRDAVFLEFGTGADKPGSRSPWGPNTPTPEFAPAAITAHHFRGTAP